MYMPGFQCGYCSGLICFVQLRVQPSLMHLCHMLIFFIIFQAKYTKHHSDCWAELTSLAALNPTAFNETVLDPSVAVLGSNAVIQ